MLALKERLRWALAGSVLERPAKAVWARLNRHEVSRYDLQTEQIVARFAKPYWNCADVGANNGDIADLLLLQCPQGQHTLFEPIPAKAALLRHKYRRRPNVKIVEAALSDQAGTTTFHYNVAHPATSGIKRQTYFTKNNRIELIEVRLARLDDEAQAIDIIKIDVEGAELGVLRGGIETVKRSRLVIFEHGPHGASHYGYGAGEIFDYFAAIGFGIHLLADFLEGKQPLSREQMLAYHKAASEWYFVASR